MKPALIVTPRLPWPLDDGGRIALWQTVWSASRSYETVLVSLVPEGQEGLPAPSALAEIGVEVLQVPHRPPSNLASAWSGLAGPWPYTLARYRSARLVDTLARVVRERKPAFALVNHLHLGTYVDALAPTPMVLRQHNVEHVWMARYAAMRGATPAGWYARIQAERLRRAEARLCRASALVLAIQDEERETLRRLAPQARIETLPVGVDLGRFREPSPVQPPIVLIAGSFGWPPNEEGARRFLKEGWPLVRQSHPDSRLRVAGKDISESLARAASDAGAEVAGYVESMPTEFSDASVLVVPLWVGAGARVKIVESLAAGLPVVSTTVGVEGLGLSDGTHYLRADTPVALAAAVSSLLATAEKRTALSSNGRRKAQETWSLEAVARLQNRYCEEVATP